MQGTGACRAHRRLRCARLQPGGRVDRAVPRQVRHGERNLGRMKKFPLEKIEKASRKALRELQLKRLKWSLKHAYDRVPHYRRKFDTAGVKPKDLKTLADLAKFPFTAKADLRET